MRKHLRHCRREALLKQRKTQITPQPHDWAVGSGIGGRPGSAYSPSTKQLLVKQVTLSERKRPPIIEADWRIRVTAHEVNSDPFVTLLAGLRPDKLALV